MLPVRFLSSLRESSSSVVIASTYFSREARWLWEIADMILQDSSAELIWLWSQPSDLGEKSLDVWLTKLWCDLFDLALSKFFFRSYSQIKAETVVGVVAEGRLANLVLYMWSISRCNLEIADSEVFLLNIDDLCAIKLASDFFSLGRLLDFIFLIFSRFASDKMELKNQHFLSLSLERKRPLPGYSGHVPENRNEPIPIKNEYLVKRSKSKA